MNTEKVNCYLCNIDDSKYYDEENGFTYVQCNNCSLIYLNPRPSLQNITESHKIGMHRGDKMIDVTGKYKKSKISSYSSIINDFYSEELSDMDFSSWLDIGCGNGEFLETLRIVNNKLILKGSEPNQFKVQNCKNRGLDVDWIKDLDKHEIKYNYISLLNVYSHLPNPILFVEKIKKLLKPNGELFLQTGHSSHLPAALHHKPYFAPDHLSFANKDIVDSILKKAGFTIISTKIYRHPQFPTTKKPKRILIEAGKIILNKGGRVSNFFPKNPNRDMYVRAKLEE